ncbi:MAG TPA: type II secretion system F family protein [Chloroflexota bacterium]|nr:type II secretion system F family protein [Chloroflexota bacterium]
MSLQPFDVLPAVLAAAGVLIFCAGVATLGRRYTLHRRLQSHVQAGNLPSAWHARGPGDEGRLAGVAASFTHRLRQSQLGLLVQARLIRAGVSLSAEHFIRLQALAGGIAALAAYIAVRASGTPIQLLAALLVGALGFGAPLLVVGQLEKRRLGAFEKQLPQAIDSMAGTLQAGSALPPAMEIIGREMPAPISIEFRRVLREMELGLSLPDSLANLQDRVRSADVVLLTSAITIQQRVGGDLAGILKGISHTIRERLRIRSEINVLTAQGRYSAYIITALPFLLFLFLWFTNRPYVSQLFLPGVTQLMLIAGLTGIVLGYVSMKKIITIEV